MKIEIPHTVKSKIENTSGEVVFLLVIIGISTYMFVGSYEFARADTSYFPRFIASVTIACGLLLLFKNYLPVTVQRFITDDAGLLESEGSEDGVSVADAAEQPTSPSETIDLPTGASHVQEEAVETVSDTRTSLSEALRNDTAFLILLTTGYVVAGYLIGLLFATPLFTLLYMLKTEQPWYLVIGLPALAFIIAIGFNEVLNVPVDRGVLYSR